MRIEYVSPVLMVVDVPPAAVLEPGARYKKMTNAYSRRLRNAVQYAGKLTWYVVKEYLRLIFLSRINIVDRVIKVACPAAFLRYTGTEE